MLHLAYEHPCSSNSPTALVDISHVLADTSVATLQAGAWINVIGYVAYQSTSKKPLSKIGSTEVQALLLWPTGGAIAGQPSHNEVVSIKRKAMQAMAEARRCG